MASDTVAAVKILVDHSVRQDALTEEHGVQFAEGQLFGKPYRYLQFVTRTRPRRNDWKQAEIDCLPEIAELIRQGRVEAFTTDELYAEGFRAEKYPQPQHTDIFAGCGLAFLPAPLDRSKWGLDGDQFASKADVIGYCESFFLTASPKRIERFIRGMRENPRYSLTPFEEGCLQRVQVFKAICRGIERTHYPDALHLWTAEENGMDVFLTHDRKYLNVISRQAVDLRCKVMLPSMFLASLERGSGGSSLPISGS